MVKTGGFQNFNERGEKNMIKFLQGDCIEQMKTLPDESVHCVVTSPPYWGLRDYGVAGQIGLEKTPDCGKQGKVKLKQGLTKDQIIFVAQRLLDAGLLGDVSYDTFYKG
jgi:DNA modification methylase